MLCCVRLFASPFCLSLFRPVVPSPCCFLFPSSFLLAVVRCCSSCCCHSWLFDLNYETWFGRLSACCSQLPYLLPMCLPAGGARERARWHVTPAGWHVTPEGCGRVPHYLLKQVSCVTTIIHCRIGQFFQSATCAHMKKLDTSMRPCALNNVVAVAAVVVNVDVH